MSQKQAGVRPDRRIVITIRYILKSTLLDAGICA